MLEYLGADHGGGHFVNRRNPMGNRPTRTIYEQYGVGSPPVTRKRRSRWLYVLLSVPLVALVAGGVYLGAILLATRDAVGQVFVPSVRATEIVSAARPTTPPVVVQPGEPTPVPPVQPTAVAPPVLLPEWEGKERLNILLMGVDRRDDEEIARSDTLILVSIDPVGKRVGMLSIPRDLWVTIPGFGKDKINAAYPIGEKMNGPGGGTALAMKTVEHNFRVPVHYFATVDFAGFTRIVDSVGGIMVDVPYVLKDDAYPTDEGSNYMRFVIQSGMQSMDGQMALRYARSRNFDSDFGRQRRQQQVLQAIRDKGMSLDAMTRLPEFISAVGGAFRTDISPLQWPGLARLASEIERDNVKSFGITPDMIVVHDTPEIYYLDPIWPEINAALAEMVGEQPAPAATAGPTRPAAGAPVQPTARTTRAASPTVTPAVRPLVWVRNGTRTQGLAARGAETLRGHGYTIGEVTQDARAGQYPRSLVYVYGVERAQGVAVAEALGLPGSAVRAGPSPSPGTGVLVILGDDAAR